MRIAAIDVGTNTAKMVVAEWDGQRLRPLVQEARYVRLGEGVDASGRIGARAMERLKEALLDYKKVAEKAGAERVTACGTSASRDAQNKGELVDFVRRETGLVYEIISGEEEALWSFAGTCSAFDDLGGPCAVVDVGGGSTEVVIGEARPGRAPEVAYRRSLQLGTVRLAERHFSKQPPTAAEAAAAEAEARRRLATGTAGAPPTGGLPLLGGAGTVKVLARISGAARLPATLAHASVREWRQRLLQMSYDEVLALSPRLMRPRADVFPAGVLILDALMERFGFEACRASPRALVHGLALRALMTDDDERTTNGEA